MKSLESKVAIVTGASSGIGRATAELLAQEGARLVLNARDGARLEELAQRLRQRHGDVCAVVAGDVALEETAQVLVDTAERRFGGLDLAFNNAGSTGRMGPLAELAADEWNRVIAVNLDSAFFAVRHQIPAMQRRGAGSIVFTSSFVGHTAGMPGMGAYAAAKAGLIGLTQVLAVEAAAHGIRVNALLPGGTDTGMNPANAPDAAPETLAFIQGLHALKRIATPEEIAQAALFLLSQRASFVTGSAMLVDGGASISKV